MNKQNINKDMLNKEIYERVMNEVMKNIEIMKEVFKKQLEESPHTVDGWDRDFFHYDEKEKLLKKNLRKIFKYKLKLIQGKYGTEEEIKEYGNALFLFEVEKYRHSHTKDPKIMEIMKLFQWTSWN